MPNYFPQVNSNLILTQLPYQSKLSYETVVNDLETGIRYSFPRRAANLDGYPTVPLGKFGINFSSITDTEVSDLKTFFDARRGRWESFRFLDPGGNLLQYSEDFTKSYWDKSSGVTTGATVADPFGGNLATSLAGTGGDSKILGVIGPTDGGMSGFRMCVSVWVNARDPNASIFLGFTDGTTTRGSTIQIPYQTWRRISYSDTIWTSSQIKAVMGGSSTWSGGKQIYTYGFQVSPMKGEGAYVRTPGNYGYHENVRFDVDSFSVNHLGPNQNQVNLPLVEVNT